MRELLEEIAALSLLITLQARDADGSVRAPSFSVSRVGSEMGIRFAGIPMGHEITSLVLALLQAGGHPPKADAAVFEQIKALDADLDFEVYISLSCQNCPDVVQAPNLMAGRIRCVSAESPHVTFADASGLKRPDATDRIKRPRTEVARGTPFPRWVNIGQLQPTATAIAWASAMSSLASSTSTFLPCCARTSLTKSVRTAQVAWLSGTA